MNNKIYRRPFMENSYTLVTQIYSYIVWQFGEDTVLYSDRILDRR